MQTYQTSSQEGQTVGVPVTDSTQSMAVSGNIFVLLYEFTDQLTHMFQRGQNTEIDLANASMASMNAAQDDINGINDTGTRKKVLNGGWAAAAAITVVSAAITGAICLDLLSAGTLTGLIVTGAGAALTFFALGAKGTGSVQQNKISTQQNTINSENTEITQDNSVMNSMNSAIASAMQQYMSALSQLGQSLKIQAV